MRVMYEVKRGIHNASAGAFESLDEAEKVARWLVEEGACNVSIWEVGPFGYGNVWKIERS